MGIAEDHFVATAGQAVDPLDGEPLEPQPVEHVAEDSQVQVRDHGPAVSVHRTGRSPLWQWRFAHGWIS